MVVVDHRPHGALDAVLSRIPLGGDRARGDREPGAVRAAKDPLQVMNRDVRSEALMARGAERSLDLGAEREHRPEIVVADEERVAGLLLEAHLAISPLERPARVERLARP